MPRIARGLVDGFVYHILNRGNGKQQVLHKDKDYKTFICLMGEAKDRYPVKVFAYCLMPNHFHLVLMPHKAYHLSSFMQRLMTKHVRCYHKHYSSSGHIWQGRFKSFPIQEDEHLTTNITDHPLASVTPDDTLALTAQTIDFTTTEVVLNNAVAADNDWVARGYGVGSSFVITGSTMCAVSRRGARSPLLSHRILHQPARHLPLGGGKVGWTSKASRARDSGRSMSAPARQLRDFRG